MDDFWGAQEHVCQYPRVYTTARETTNEKISKLDASLLFMHWYHQAQNDDTLILALEGSQSMFRSPKSCHAKLILYGNRDRSACH